MGSAVKLEDEAYAQGRGIIFKRSSQIQKIRSACKREYKWDERIRRGII